MAISKLYLLIPLFMALGHVTYLGSQGQHRALPKRCDIVVDSSTPQYQVGQVRYTADDPPQKYLLISIDPGQFTREHMIALANRLRQEFCEEKQFGVMFFDDEYAAKHVTFLSSTKSLEVAYRGLYTVDRKKKREHLQFSTARGKPLDEIRIQLQPEKK